MQELDLKFENIAYKVEISRIMALGADQGVNSIRCLKD